MANHAKDNFNQAMFSMFGVGKDPDAVKESATFPAPVPAKEAAPAPVPAPAPAPQPKPRTYIAEGTVCEGNLSSSGDMEIAGSITGNVTSAGQILLRAPIVGNITAEKLHITNCTVTGDVHISGMLILEKGSSIEGNVFAKEFTCSGSVKGDLNITGILSLKESAQVEGNIVTDGMEMSSGARFSGNVVMGQKSK